MTMTISEDGQHGSHYTITDDFMFSSVFSDIELCRGLVETLLDIKIESIEFVDDHELLDAGPLARAGIVDLLARDTSGNTFDVEMQNDVRGALARRARYYGSLIDLAILDHGQSFGELPDRVVIFLCPTDPFGRGWKRYNFPRICLQDGVPLGDGTDLVFVNAEGLHGSTTPELDAFLRYLLNDTMVEGDFVTRVDAAVRSRRKDPVWRRKRMLWSQKYRDDFSKARLDGLAEGRAEGRAEGLEEGRAEGREEGREQGRTEGAIRQLDALSELANRLEAQGRGDEALRALRDPALRKRLMQEFDIPDV